MVNNRGNFQVLSKKMSVIMTRVINFNQINQCS